MRKKKKYVVGYDKDEGLIMGKETCYRSGVIDVFTFSEAQKELKTFEEDGVVIYELKPIDNKGSHKRR